MITEPEFNALSAQGYNRIPLMAEAFADLETPLSLYLKLAHVQDGAGSGPHASLPPSGRRIGAYSFLGVNAALAHQVIVAADNYIAMGAAVTRSTEPDRVYQGSPATAREMTAKRFCKVRD